MVNDQCVSKLIVFGDVNKAIIKKFLNAGLV